MATVVALAGTGHMCRLCFHWSPPHPCIILHLPCRSQLRPWKETSIRKRIRTPGPGNPRFGSTAEGGNPRSSAASQISSSNPAWERK